MSSQSPSPPATPHNELLELTQQLTPRKTPRRVRQICLDLQSRANDASKAHGDLKRKLVDISNQADNAPRRKPRLRHRRAAEATDEVTNPATLEERVRSAGRHFAVEYGLFLHCDVEQLFATALDPNFEEATEFDSEESRIQGQIRDILPLLPDDARDIEIRRKSWIAKCFEDGLSGQRSNINTRIRQESITHIAANTKFQDLSHDFVTDVDVSFADFDSSSSRFAAFSRYIGYQEATDNTDAFYSPLKAQVLYKDYDGTMDPYKIFRGPALLSIYVSIIRGKQGAKGLFRGKSKLPSASVIERTRHIERTSLGAIADSSVLKPKAIWLFSADTQLLAEGDETKIDYRHLWVTFMRQISKGLREDAAWAKDLFRYWDEILFPHADNSHSQAPSANRKAVCAEIDAMDAAFEDSVAPRATPSFGSLPHSPSDTGPSHASTSSQSRGREHSPDPTSSPRSSRTRPSQSPGPENSAHAVSAPSRSESSNHSKTPYNTRRRRR
ncbi:hypothetical protein B0H15DRAFT_929841 [Mycena belliarum]|uniref:Uncharacterized protein n=1 Tax=Mycena belliarum TaxID=1033014 RepID=A0AAD6U6X7_9AGAR|nr:hypothetical protein B0H15DRAFT_929841 [Mycena belliae]